VAEFRKAIELNPKWTDVRTAIGGTLEKKGDLDGAVAEFRKAIEIDPKSAGAHNGLGWALYRKRDLDGAIAECRKAIALDPKLPWPHNTLGLALHGKRDLEGAVGEFRKALELNPKWTDVHITIGWARLEQRRFVAATRSFGDAFAADPKLAADLNRQLRYRAAGCAARAAAGEGEDAKGLPDKVRLGLRRQALAWLREDLAQYRKLAESTEATAKQTVRQHLGRWQVDAALATVRGPAALDRLPDNERRQWRALWDDVAALLKKAEAGGKN
jgi:tetratricopeptide (TPR) repeat protein